MNLLALPAFADNDLWMWHDGARAVVVEPADAAPVHSALGRLQPVCGAILVTPHDASHVGTADTPGLPGRADAPAHARDDDDDLPVAVPAAARDGRNRA
jgi:hydroxyacylglutathione hydrolase